MTTERKSVQFQDTVLTFNPSILTPLRFTVAILYVWMYLLLSGYLSTFPTIIEIVKQRIQFGRCLKRLVRKSRKQLRTVGLFVQGQISRVEMLKASGWTLGACVTCMQLVVFVCKYVPCSQSLWETRRHWNNLSSIRRADSNVLTAVPLNPHTVTHKQHQPSRGESLPPLIRQTTGLMKQIYIFFLHP